MNFRDLLQKINGLHIKYQSGAARVEAVYWETGRALILIDEGTNYTVYDEYRGIAVSFVSDGHDRITVDIQELEKFN